MLQSRVMIRTDFSRAVFRVLFALWCVWLLKMSGCGPGKGLFAEAKTIWDSPYVSFSPDGTAWTTDADNRQIRWYAEDGSDDVRTGVPSSLLPLQTGEHYYSYKRIGEIPIGEWRVALGKVQCCHTDYPDDSDFHGVDFNKRPCFQDHFSGWRAYCADCGELLSRHYFYMSREACRSIHSVPVGPGIGYYYLCPFNRNLEQGVDTVHHRCKAVSANRYRVVYHANAPFYTGYMEPSIHLYNNADTYEGKAVTPQTCLNPNAYCRAGYAFTGWNTRADGSGTGYADGEAILNLCDEQDGEIVLYACWRRAAGKLNVKAGSGKFSGGEDSLWYEGGYGTSCEIETDKIIPPDGYLLNFNAGEGTADVMNIRGTRHLSGWKKSADFKGRLEGNTYYFSAWDGVTDVLEAQYQLDPICLPDAYLENHTFAGWYRDFACTEYVGKKGDYYTPTNHEVMHAKFVALDLESVNNYVALGGSGAVDLSWVQPDAIDKVYQIFQSENLKTWKMIYDTTDGVKTSVSSAEEFAYDGETHRYTVPVSGYYKITAIGAQGGNYEDWDGGGGGKVSATFWLEKDERLTYTVGGQDGYPGGGSGDPYASGGGYTEVVTNRKGVLLQAGGGGGAIFGMDGVAGGTDYALTEDSSNGESGPGGGGGGWRGGQAGVYECHYHTEGVCNHVHEGVPTKSGGCYKKSVRCGEPMTHEYSYTRKWYWGGLDELYCPNCGADATKGQKCKGHEEDMYNHSCPVHGLVVTNAREDWPSACTKVVGYEPNCGLTTDYTCGYLEDGYVIRHSPSGGGSSYINEEYAQSPEAVAGCRAGNGKMRIETGQTGFSERMSLAGVPAKDRAAPRAVEANAVQKIPRTDGKIELMWEEPSDKGTTYYHKVCSYSLESCLEGEPQMLAQSNIRKNILISGVRGYYWILDDNPATKVTEMSGNFTGDRTLTVTLTENEQYLHICAIDQADNLSVVTHIKIAGTGEATTEIPWPIRTNPLRIREEEGICAAGEENTYYVRSDGSFPFMLRYGAYMEGYAGENYQIDQLITEMQSAGEAGTKYRVLIPTGSAELLKRDDEKLYPASLLRFFTDEKGWFSRGSYGVARRSGQCRVLSFEQEYVMSESAHGKKMKLIPIAAANCGETVVYSDYPSDCLNAINIIGDARAPVVEGTEILENLEILDRRQGEVVLNLRVSDDVSGCEEAFVRIENTDNGCTAAYPFDEEGKLSLNITADEPVFSGDFTVTIETTDRVGNRSVLQYGTSEFDLQASVKRILAPHDAVFKKGESGILHISSRGYAQRVEVEFPQEIAGGAAPEKIVFDYTEDASYKREEDMEFMIPLRGATEGSYRVTVRAYKGDRMIERYPELAVIEVSGSVTDDLRTRLR